MLVITTPGPAVRRSSVYREIVAVAPPEQDVLVTTRLRRPIPLLKSLAPDLIVSFTFPYRIPPEVTTIPRFGAVNLHPAPLPLYRGPNPMRMIYDAAPTLGATLHRTEEDFDTGVIYSRQERPMPEEVTTENVFAAWIPCMQTALEEGVRRAVAGDPGTPQDHASATYGAAFSEDEHWLDWNAPVRLLQCRATAVNLFAPPMRANIDGSAYIIGTVQPLRGMRADGPPGTVIDHSGGSFTLCAADGVVRVEATAK
ncbi:MAG TPA: formyltransferase family protein [Steroidobacteraceae bacterium]|nr:formyltransferase family protein [Steroidobacteraceae bacterium]